MSFKKYQKAESYEALSPDEQEMVKKTLMIQEAHKKLGDPPYQKPSQPKTWD